MARRASHCHLPLEFGHDLCKGVALGGVAVPAPGDKGRKAWGRAWRDLRTISSAHLHTHAYTSTCTDAHT